MTGKLICKKLMVQILYFLIMTIIMIIVGNFIPNAIYMLVISCLAIAGLVYLRRSKRGEPEDEYLAGTTSDDLIDDIKYLFGGFSEFRAEVVSAAVIAGFMIAVDIAGMIAVVNEGKTVGRFDSIVSFIFMYAVFFVADAVIWLVLFRQYHSSRVSH